MTAAPGHRPPATRVVPVLVAVAVAGVAVLAAAPSSVLVAGVAAVVALGAVLELARRLGQQLATVGELVALEKSTAEELVVATRMVRARAETMTSVIDAVTEQSIIGTDPDGTIRVWNPGAEKIGRASCRERV